MTDVETMGPISYLIVEFPGGKTTGEGLPILLDLVDRGLIRVLDLLFVARDEDGSMSVIDLSDLDMDGYLDVTVFQGATSGLLDESDAADAMSAISPGAAAAILLFENRWAREFTEAIRHGGAEFVAAGYVPMDALVASVDATE
jgi:hypothetical protein